MIWINFVVLRGSFIHFIRQKNALLSSLLSRDFFFFDWGSLHARLNTTTRHGVTRKEVQKKLQDTKNLFRKNLQLEDFC